MTLEEQFAQVAKEQERNFEREIIAGATYLKLINEHFGPGSDYYYQKEHLDDDWDDPQKKVWRYLLTNDHVSYIHLTELLRDCGTGVAVWNLLYHCLWMSYFCLCESDEDVDEVIEQADSCDHCRDTAVCHMMQYVLFNQPMSAQIVSAIVHQGGMGEFAQMMWEVVEATGQGFYHTESNTNTLQVA